MNRLNRVLLIIAIILAVATAILWFEPEIYSSLSALNPFSSRETGDIPMATTGTSPFVQPSANSPLPVASSVDPVSVSDQAAGKNDTDASEAREKELSPFEKDIQQRTESYQTKIYTYDPYQPPVLRNPFKRMVSTVYLEEEEEKIVEELVSEEAVRRFVQPELPPGSKFTGIISAGAEKLAILEIDEETYIVKEGDFLLDKFLIKSISDEKVVIDVNGFEITLQLGGGEATNE